MWFLVVLTILSTGEKDVKLFRIEGAATCQAAAAKTDRVLSHDKNNVRAYHVQCVKSEST